MFNFRSKQAKLGMALVLLALLPTPLSAHNRRRRARAYVLQRAYVLRQTYRKFKKHNVKNNTKNNPPIINTERNTPQGPTNIREQLIAAKNNLKAVPEDKKNIYAKQLLARRDFYNAEADMASFVEKMKKGNVVFKNETNQPVTVVLSLQYKNNTQAELKRERIRLKPYAFYILSDEQNTLVHVKILEKNYFLNPKWTLDSQLQLSIEKEQDRFFLHQYHDFAFKSKLFTEQEIETNQ